MDNYVINGKVVEITLDNGKVVKAMTSYLENMVKNLDIDMDEAVLTWLEDEEYLVNDDQEKLVQQAKENKSHKIIDAKAENPKKTQRERVAKPNPDKEFLIQVLFKALGDTNECSNTVISNKSKIIEFSYKGKEFKLDLIEKRKKKEDK